MSEKLFFSVITPAYCGALFLRRLYENLLVVKSRYSAFEWIIVDDYSPDQGATVREIQKIQAEGLLQIEAIFLEQNFYNSKSIPAAARIAGGSYTIILDQDDFLEHDALITYSDYIALHASKPNFAGVCARCVNLDGEMIGSVLPLNEIYTNELELRHRYKVRGEMLQCTKTVLISDYFNSLEPGNTNGLAWLRLAQKFNYLYVQRSTRRYDSLNPVSVSNQRKVRYVGAVARQYIEVLNASISYFLLDPVYLFRISVHAKRWVIHATRSCKNQPPKARFSVRILFVFAMPIAWVLYYRDIRNKAVYCN